ncbi:hypothetical protein WMF45_41615 [Sorangium sp. So ce448]|uniref:hypothetical protein n=1 Tax=Sorangium sp. So ce448 TaxID=3133314 RepID=UPI003F5FB928
MAVPSSPASDFCSACGFPLRGPRCEACGVDRSPVLSASRKPPADADWDGSSIDAWRTRDPVRFVAHCASAEAGASLQATTLQEGVGWIVPLGAMTLFVSLDAANERVSIDVPVVRVAERHRVPLLRTALELSSGPEPFRLCMREDLLLLRRVGRVAAFTPEALRQALRESGEAAQRLGETMGAWFDARPPFSEEQRTSLTWASAGRARPLKSFTVPPAPARQQSAPSVRAGAPATPVSGARTPLEELAAWAAPPLPRLPESVARPIRDADAIPDILSPSLASAPMPAAGAASSKNGGAPAPKAGILPPAHDAGAASKAIGGVASPGSEGGAAKPAPGSAATAAPLSGELAAAAETSAQVSDRRSARTVPFRRSSSIMAATPLSVRPPALPEVEIEPPSRRSIPSRPESANAAADRFCQLLRDAQVLGAALSFQERPGVMVLLIRCTVFRAIYEHGEAMPDAVAHLYRCTAAATRELIQAEGGARRGNTAGVAEPALLAMERLVAVRGQVPEEKPLHIDPLTTAALAREHLGRYLREIERAPADPMLRHFLAIGALSELLVRTKLPAKTEQRLRDIVAYAQRDGAKPGTIELLMTALSRIVAQ